MLDTLTDRLHLSLDCENPLTASCLTRNIICRSVVLTIFGSSVSSSHTGRKLDRCSPSGFFLVSCSCSVTGLEDVLSTDVTRPSRGFCSSLNHTKLSTSGTFPSVSVSSSGWCVVTVRNRRGQLALGVAPPLRVTIVNNDFVNNIIVNNDVFL